MHQGRPAALTSRQTTSAALAQSGAKADLPTDSLIRGQMNSAAGASGEALELIRYDVDSGKFQVGERAIAILRDIRTPLSVVAVCGRARQGKSFILNNILQVTGGFQIGSTTRPCTKGLWMWSTPQRRLDDDGKEFHIVLLDTEGIDAYDQTAQYSTQIFSLAVLLSSLFVYNQFGGIDEAALDRLSLVTEMTRHIKVRASKSNCDDSELAGFTPSFVWLLRDFYLRLEDELGRQVTARDYLETALMPVAGSGAAVEAKNQIRSSIKSLFPDRDCFTLVRPMHDEQALVTLDHIQPDQLRPEFREGVASLIQLIFNKAQPKRLGEFTLSGPLLAGLTESYVKAINDGAVPTIATAWQGVAEQECRRAADVGEAAYAAAFDESVAAEEPVLEQEHARCLGVARAAFAEVAVGDARIQRIHQHKLTDCCAARYAQVRARKLAEAAALVNELLLKASSLAASAMAADNVAPDTLQGLLGQFLDEYVATAAGPLKWVKLVEFLKTTYPRLIADVAARREAQARADVSRLAEELGLAHKQIHTLHATVDKASADLSDSRAQLEQQQGLVRQLQGRLLQQAEELAECRVQHEDKAGQVAALHAQLRELQLVGEKNLMAVQQEAAARQSQSRVTAQQEISSLQAKLAAEQRLGAELRTQVCELQAALDGLSAQLASERAEGAEHLQRFSQSLADNSSLARQLDELKVALAAAEMQLQLAEQQRGEAQQAAADLTAQLEAIGAEIAGHVAEAEADRQHSSQRHSQLGLADSVQTQHSSDSCVAQPVGS